MQKPYIIKIISQKGGVGKTAIAVNLSVALKEIGYNTLLIDSDLINPSVAFYLGLEDANVGLSSVIAGSSKLSNAIIKHIPTGLYVLPNIISNRLTMPVDHAIEKFNLELMKSGYDFIVIDTPPGISTNEIIKNVDESIIISTPEMPACVSCFRLIKEYKKRNIRYVPILNKVKNRNFELNQKEIEEALNEDIALVIPEDHIVQIGLSERIPAYLINPNSKFSKAIYALAVYFVHKAGKTEMLTKRQGILSLLIKKLIG